MYTSYQAYPAWRYHIALPPRIVQNEAEDKALGPGWAPHWLDLRKKQPSVPPVVAPEPPAPRFAPPEVEPEPPELAEDVRGFLRTKVANLVPQIAEMTDAAAIARWREVEVAHPNYPGGRPNILRALNARLAELQAPMTE